MPVNFVTGLPRQGKTLFTICFVKERAEREKRPVYYCNIPEVTVPGWKELQHPDAWESCENDSIIIVDELQDFWGMAGTGQKVPLPILELSKHGKRGIDFYFITQDPSLVHSTPRKLCETHYHVVRAFGTESAMVHKFARMQNDPERVKSKGEKLPFKYPREVFGKKDRAGNWITKPWYKSADVHNIKRKIPLKVLGIPLLIAFALGMIYLAAQLLMGVGKSASGVAAADPSAAGAKPPAQAQQSRAHEVRGPVTTHDLVASYRPRIEGMPQTAPRYDELTKPKDAPYPAICMQMGARCTCYTQQSTKLDTPKDLCMQIVENGMFIDWKDSRQSDGAQSGGAQKVHESAKVEGAPPAALESKHEQKLAHWDVSQGLIARNSQVKSTVQN